MKKLKKLTPKQKREGLKKIFEAMEKPNLSKILDDGFEDTGERYKSLSILKRGNERVLYSAKIDEIIIRYTSK